MDIDINREIILACEAGIKELEAIKDYSEKLAVTQSEPMKQVYTDNRMDELPHIQNITVALTALLNGEEPSEAAQMDGADEQNEDCGVQNDGDEAENPDNGDEKPDGGDDGE